MTEREKMLFDLEEYLRRNDDRADSFAYLTIVGIANDVSELEAKNAKLREELAKWERLAAGIELPEYPVTQFKPKDLERENANLQERIHKLEMEGSDHFYRMAYAEDANRTLEDENAKLREQGARLFDKTLELGTENDKLRELVRDMWHEGSFEPGAYCVPEAYGLAERTRELGIEVDGWLS